ncbi:hypothetical protein [Paraburkholderia terrae]
MPWPIPSFASVEKPEPISPRRWLLALAAIASGSVGAVLLLWPHGKPTQTFQFWGTLFGAPLVACAVAFGMRLDRWEAEQTVAEESELERERLMGLWREWCRRHLRIVDAAAFLPVTDELASFCDAKAKLPMNVDRTVGFAWSKDRPVAFRRTRMLHLVAARFADALRHRREMVITLLLNDASSEQVEVWKTRAHRIFTRTAPGVVFRVEARQAMGCAQWLVEQVDIAHTVPRLVIAVQIWPDGEAEHKFSEGAGAFLIEPGAPEAGSIFRPMMTAPDTLEADLAQLAQMQVAPDRLTHIWFTDCSDEAVTITSTLTLDPKAPLLERNLDSIVGQSGPASGWIALATALEASQRTGPSLVGWREPGDEPLNLCMIAPAQSQRPHRETQTCH